MSSFASAAPLPSIPFEGSDAPFVVGRIFCVARNYADHAREMGQDPSREPPFFFSKFAQALVPGGGPVPYPPACHDLHYEGELVLAIGRAGVELSTHDALDVVCGYAVGLDMTRRDLQAAARKQGRPWDSGKSFAGSAPLAPLRPVARGHVGSGLLETRVNGKRVQGADVSAMIWSPAEILVHLSRLERLVPGDLVFTGTPAGVGPVVPGDRIRVTIEGLMPLEVEITPRVS